MKKSLLYFCLMLIVAMGAGFFIASNSNLPAINFLDNIKPINFVKLEVPKNRLPQEPTSTILVFGGDVMLSRVVGQKMVKYNDFTWPFEKVADIFKKADIAAVNLESPFTKAGNHVVLTGSFAFNADPKALAGLNLAGIDLITLANNHFGNQGQIGMNDTFDLLTQNKIKYVGAGKNITEAHAGKIIEVGGVKFGFLGYAYPDDLYVATEKLAGLADMDLALAKKDVAELKKQADVVVVQMHAGTEYTAKPNQQQINFAHVVIDAGADLVVGHHPHWVQITEIYKGKPILYSLGNLVFDQMWSPETQQGAVAKVEFADKTLTKIEILPIHINDYGQPEIVSSPVEIQKILKQMNLSSAVINLK